ncbi:MAG: 30S ribosomal protein S6 [Gemmatales bacterium]|nr:30S ribosomal protein S6 [Gemmatales bacterium]MCS7161012.1 30S ribosomal protein S6 [Gemmatales bacterium]MDW8176215.1 30S ribosomal protein S6 [Gemmatales bacterium]MDW8221672.1 30S ribosomal protein S6 [Gemmatales bacterium]
MTAPTHLYECLLLFDSNKYQTQKEKLIEQVHQTLQRHGATIETSRFWDERRLVYPIKKQRKGSYHLIFFRAPGKALPAIREDFRINENLLRFLILRHHPRMEETLLALGREERALAIQAPGLAEETEAEVVAQPAEQS